MNVFNKSLRLLDRLCRNPQAPIVLKEIKVIIALLMLWHPAVTFFIDLLTTLLTP